MKTRRMISTAIGAVVLALATIAPSVSAAPAAGAVYSESNSPAGNSILVWTRNADGSLAPAGSVATGGVGTGAGLGSQGAVTLSADGDWLFAVNAGSNSISAFRADGTGLALADVEPSGGVRPTSVTAHGNLVYVLNAGGDGNIAGFRRHGGDLEPIAGSIRPLTNTAANPGQISFSPDGKFLVVVERANNRVVVYPVKNGVAGAPTFVASPGAVPFGFAFTRNRTLVISEAATGTSSSYSLTPNGGLELIDAAVPDFQAAPCWYAATADGRFAYTTNAGSGTISGYEVREDGTLRLLDADGITASFGANTGPTDEAVSSDSRYLYAVLGRVGMIAAMRIEADGSLTSLGTVPGLPAGAAGLAGI